MLGKPDIDRLSLLSFNCETTYRQVEVHDSAENSAHESPIQIESGKSKQFESEKQDAEAQSQHNVDNTAKPTTVTNPTVTGNNSNENSFSAETINKDSNNFISELKINENQSFVSDQLRGNDMAAADTKETREIHTNDNESFILDQYMYPDLEAQTIQKKKKRKQIKKKK